MIVGYKVNITLTSILLRSFKKIRFYRNWLKKLRFLHKIIVITVRGELLWEYIIFFKYKGKIPYTLI